MQTAAYVTAALIARACCDTSQQEFLHETYSSSLNSLRFHLHWRYLGSKSCFVQECGNADHLAYGFENENHIPGEYCCGFSPPFSHVVTTIFAQANFCGISKSILVDCGEKCWCFVSFLK